MASLSHTDESGKARMVDVSAKDITIRSAAARAEIRMKRETLDKILQNDIRKGDVLAVAKCAGIMAAKNTSALIPLCHPLLLTHIDVSFEPDAGESRIIIRSEVRLEGRTGAEMEALTASAIAALTIYDMCKAVDREMTIGDVCLLEKTGGKSGDYKRIHSS